MPGGGALSPGSLLLDKVLEGWRAGHSGCRPHESTLEGRSDMSRGQTVAPYPRL